MAVRIRLRRMGRKKKPCYRIAVVDPRKKRDGRFIEFIGFYDPTTDPYTLRLQEEKISEWLDKGASLSSTVETLFRKEGVLARLHEKKTGQSVEKKARETEPVKAAPKPAPAKEEPKVEEAPVAEEPKAEEAKVEEAPAVEEAKAEEAPVAEEAKAEEAPAAEEAKAEEAPVAEEAKAEETPAAEAAKAEEAPAAEEAKAEEEKK